jgi:hypothetical protein
VNRERSSEVLEAGQARQETQTTKAETSPQKPADVRLVRPPTIRRVGAITDAMETYSLDKWPFRWCSPEEARGFVTRLRNGDTRNQVATEVGVSPRSISRAVRYVLLADGQYDADGWFEHKREARREGRRRFLELVAKRDDQEKRTSEAVRAERRQLALAAKARERHTELEHRTTQGHL